MLNPQLYYSLVQQFGRVSIQNEGYEADRQYTMDAYGKYDLEYRHGEYYVLNCPFCHDSKRRLYVSYLWGVPEEGRTWNNRLNLARCFNDTDCLRIRENRDYLVQVIYQLLPGQRPHPVHIERGIVFSEQSRAFESPGDCVSLTDLPSNHPANLYLLSRGYDPVYLAQTFFVNVCVNASPQFPLMQNRINAPIFFRDANFGWQGRVPADLNWKECGIPKYYNWPGMPKSEVLYNFDGAQRYRVIVLYEGVTKVWRLGLNGVAVLGQGVSPRQIALLAELLGRDGALILALDPDTRRPDKHGKVREPETLAKLSASLPGRVGVIRPHCDPGDLAREIQAEMITRALAEINCPYRWDERKPIESTLPAERRILRI